MCQCFAYAYTYDYEYVHVSTPMESLVSVPMPMPMPMSPYVYAYVYAYVKALMECGIESRSMWKRARLAITAARRLGRTWSSPEHFQEAQEPS